MMNTKPTYIDFFCGSGGLSLGFESAGFELLFANDIEESSIETFLFNRSGLDSNRVVCRDIVTILPRIESIEKFNCDLVVGGPPCQGFSLANRQRMIDDPRNKLYKFFVEAIEIIRPSFFLMENVKGMMKIAPKVIDDFESIGYITKHLLLNAKDFGMPQNRERIFFFGVKASVLESEKILENIISNILQSKSSEKSRLADALWGLRPLKPKNIRNIDIESPEHGFSVDKVFYEAPVPDFIYSINCGQLPKQIYNHKARFNNERDTEIFRRLPQGGKSDHPSIADIMPYKSRSHIFKDKYSKLFADQPCKTITSHMKFDCNMYIHPFEPRGLTPREAARVQSFPDNYRFRGRLGQTYMQVGNAVPPLLAKVIAKSILKNGIRHLIKEPVLA